MMQDLYRMPRRVCPEEIEMYQNVQVTIIHSTKELVQD